METMTVAAGGTLGQEAEVPPQVIVIGNLTIDDIVRANGTTSLRSLGGNTIYAATAARIWGVGVGAVARVGDDFPPVALARLRDAGVDTLGIHPISGPTLRFWILYGEDGGRTFVSGTPTERGIEVAPAPTDVPAGWLERARRPVVHVASMPLMAAARIVGHVRSVSPSATITLDPHGEWRFDREAVLTIARQADVFLPSREELQCLLGYDDPERACAELIVEGVRAVVAHDGANGALVVTAAGSSARVAAADVVVVDETGAGDCFCGGLAAGLALGDDLLDATRRGAASAGAALGASGSLRLIDGRATLATRLLAAYRHDALPGGGDGIAADAYDITLMQREIETVPAVIRSQFGDPSPDVTSLVESLRQSATRHLVFVGCGDSAFAGQAAVLAFNRHTGLSVRAEHALDFARYSVRYQPPDTTVVAVSFSGMAGRTIEAARQARAFGHRVIALTNSPDSPLSKEVDAILPINVPTLGSSPGTSTYLGMLATFLALAAQLDTDTGGNARHSRYVDQLAMLPQLAGETLAMCAGPSLVAAQRLLGARIVTFLGAGPNEASARFGAAKLFEGAQQLAASTNVEEWAHEQYFTTQQGDPVVVVAPSGAASDRVEEILAELAYVGATIIFVGDKKPTGPVIHLPLADGAPEELSPVLAALPLSQLGFHFASLTGKRSYNFPNEQAKQEHYETIHRATVGEPA
jgi:fructoselysine-6-P-deglycase FrlB-like protein/sugar/nucleoside kinase (ribokinase family)